MRAADFKDKLKQKMNKYVHLVYEYTEALPRSEEYSLKQQFRRASLSVVLNYIEGFARRRPAVQLNFLEISYGSLKESEYLMNFCKEKKYINAEKGEAGYKLADEIGAMLWTEITNLEKSSNKK